MTKQTKRPKDLQAEIRHPLYLVPLSITYVMMTSGGLLGSVMEYDRAKRWRYGEQSGKVSILREPNTATAAKEDKTRGNCC